MITEIEGMSGAALREGVDGDLGGGVRARPDGGWRSIGGSQMSRHLL